MHTKCFNQLKADPDRQDTWIAGIIQAQAKDKGRSTKIIMETTLTGRKSKKNGMTH